MPYKGYTALTLKQEVYAKLQERYEKEHGGKVVRPSLSQWASGIIWEVIEGQEILREYGPFLEKLSISGGSVFIRDNKQNRIAELRLKNDELVCDLDGTTNCVHVGFAWAIPEVYRTMNLRARKMPQVEGTHGRERKG